MMKPPCKLAHTKKINGSSKKKRWLLIIFKTMTKNNQLTVWGLMPANDRNMAADRKIVANCQVTVILGIDKNMVEVVRMANIKEGSSKPPQDCQVDSIISCNHS